MAAVTFDSSPLFFRASTEERISTVETCMQFKRPAREFSKEDLDAEIILTETALKLNETLLMEKTLEHLKKPSHSSPKSQAVSAVSKFAELIDLPETEVFSLFEEISLWKAQRAEEQEKQTEKKGLLDLLNEEYGSHLRALMKLPPLEDSIAEMRARLPSLQKQLEEANTKKAALATEINEINTKLRKGIGDKVKLKAQLAKKKVENTALNSSIQTLKEEKEKLEADLFAKDRSFQLKQGEFLTFVHSFPERRKKIEDAISECQTKIDKLTVSINALKVYIKANLCLNLIDSHVAELQSRLDSLEEESDRRILLTRTPNR